MTANQILDGLGTVGTKHATKAPLSIVVLFFSCSLFCHCCFWECTSKLTKLSSLLQLQKFTSLCAVCSSYLAASGKEALSCLLLAVFVSQGYLFSAPSSFPLSASPLLFLLSASAIASSPLPVVIGASLSEPHTRELVEKKIIVTMCRTFWYCSN